MKYLLEFCDSIEEVVSKYNDDRNIVEKATDINEPLNRMEVFNFDLASDTNSKSTVVDKPQVVGKRKTVGESKKVVKKGRPSKKKRSVQENDITDYEFCECCYVVSDTSRSSWPSNNFKFVSSKTTKMSKINKRWQYKSLNNQLNCKLFVRLFAIYSPSSLCSLIDLTS